MADIPSAFWTGPRRVMSIIAQWWRAGRRHTGHASSVPPGLPAAAGGPASGHAPPGREGSGPIRNFPSDPGRAGAENLCCGLTLLQFASLLFLVCSVCHAQRHHPAGQEAPCHGLRPGRSVPGGTAPCAGTEARQFRTRRRDVSLEAPAGRAQRGADLRGAGGGRDDGPEKPPSPARENPGGFESPGDPPRRARTRLPACTRFRRRPRAGKERRRHRPCP